ncbi:hypothetical protein E2562_032238 [Oryza meyeriana var. granulata]|uniref:Uncharacterized protein n=1 Tax=Oryza meyeriana var. granulata TaxID=110450 RepID=A0A6G1D9W5_9ORYZ|nr:hypothetical protein E2562_032238 [Oryza meyeriana var. granulata]
MATTSEVARAASTTAARQRLQWRRGLQITWRQHDGSWALGAPDPAAVGLRQKLRLQQFLQP